MTVADDLVEDHPMTDGTLKFLELLRDDATGLFRLLEVANNPHIRRAYVRAEFASIEGEVSIIRTWALAKPSELRPGEDALLQQVTYQLQEGGHVRSTPTFQNLERMTPFVFRVCARVWGSSFELKRDGNGWRHLKESIALRNRLTHPKRLQDMEVSNEEVQAVFKGATWFRGMTEELIKDILDVVQRRGDTALVISLADARPPDVED